MSVSTRSQPEAGRGRTRQRPSARWEAFRVAETATPAIRQKGRPRPPASKLLISRRYGAYRAEFIASGARLQRAARGPSPCRNARAVYRRESETPTAASDRKLRCAAKRCSTAFRDATDFVLALKSRTGYNRFHAHSPLRNAGIDLDVFCRPCWIDCGDPHQLLGRR